MKFLEILLIIVLLNISMSFIDSSGLMPINIVETVNANYTVKFASLENYEGSLAIEKDNTTSLADRINTFLKDRDYNKNSVDTGGITTSQADTDYIKGVVFFSENIGKGIFYFEGTLRRLGIPESVYPLFIFPMNFMYLIAMLQIISGRRIEPQ